MIPPTQSKVQVIAVIFHEQCGIPPVINIAEILNMHVIRKPKN